MPTTNPLLDSLDELRNAINQESCIPKEPFIKLGQGTAPVLNYNIPQTACFSTYGNFPVKNIAAVVFQAWTKTAPPNNFFETVERTEQPVLEQRFAETIQLQSDDSKFIPNNKLLRKHLDLERTDFDAVAIPIEQGPELKVARVIEDRSSINEVQLARIAKEDRLMPFVVENLADLKPK